MGLIPQCTLSLLNSGWIGLSVMIVLSDSYLQNLEKNAIELALMFDIGPKTFCWYGDDSHAQFGDFPVYCIPVITNVQIKLHSNICSNIAIEVFKQFLSHALHICSENCLAQEIEFLINFFVENGHSITALQKVSKEYMNNITSVREKVNNRHN